MTDPLRPPKDESFQRDTAACLRSSPHLIMLAELMAGRGLRFAHGDGSTHNHVPFGVILVQGQQNVAALAEIAARLEAALDAEQIRLRDKALEG